MQQRQPDAAPKQSLVSAMLAVLSVPAPAPGSKDEDGEKGLRSEAKAAWVYLVLRAGGCNRSWAVSAGALGPAIGGGQKTGIRALRALQRFGLIEMPHRARGTFSIFITDPQEATKAWRSRTASDLDQPELDFGWPSNPPSEDAAPREAATLPLGLPPTGLPPPPRTDLAQDVSRQRTDLEQDPSALHRDARARALTSNIKHLYSEKESLLQRCPPDGSCSRTVPSSAARLDRPDPTRLSPAEYEAAVKMFQEQLRAQEDRSQSLGHALALVDAKNNPPPDRRAERARQWLERIKRRVADPLLAKYRDGRRSLGGEQMLERIAAAVTDRELKERRLEWAFSCLDFECARRAKTQDQIHSRAAYFIGIIDKIFAEDGIAWKPRLAAGPPARVEDAPTPERTSP